MLNAFNQDKLLSGDMPSTPTKNPFLFQTMLTPLHLLKFLGKYPTKLENYFLRNKIDLLRKKFFSVHHFVGYLISIIMSVDLQYL